MGEQALSRDQLCDRIAKHLSDSRDGLEWATNESWHLKTLNLLNAALRQLQPPVELASTEELPPGACFDPEQRPELARRLGDALAPVSEAGEVSLPNGCTLYWRTDPSVSCRIYSSDEIGGGVEVWNTAIIEQSTLLAAIVCEERLCHVEQVLRQRAEDREPIGAQMIVSAIADGMSVEDVAAEYGTSVEQIREALRETLRHVAVFVSQSLREDKPQ